MKRERNDVPVKYTGAIVSMLAGLDVEIRCKRAAQHAIDFHRIEIVARDDGFAGRHFERDGLQARERVGQVRTMRACRPITVPQYSTSCSSV